MMFGWLIDAARRDSRTNRSRKASFSESSALSTLSATSFPRRMLSARKTTLMPPRPSTPWMRYEAKSEPTRGMWPMLAEAPGPVGSDDSCR